MLCVKQNIILSAFLIDGGVKIVYVARIVFLLDSAALEHDTDLFLSMEKKYKINFTTLESSK